MFGYPPNITGAAQAQVDIGLAQRKADASGAFVAGDSKPNKLDTIAGYGSFVLTLDASLSSDTYSGTELQVPAIQILVCIKT